MAEKKGSALVWIGGGCLIILVIAALVAVGGGYYACRQLKQLGEDLKDPAARDAKAVEILRTEAMPEGYHTAFAMSAPLGLMRLAVLTDQEPNDRGECEGFAERGYIYVEFARFRQNEEKLAKLRDFFEGRSDDASVLRESGVRLDQKELVTRGAFALGEEQVLYAVQRGEVGFKDDVVPGIVALQMIDCPDDERMRFGIWLARDDDPDAPLGDRDLSGTPADEDAIRAFLEPLKLCE